MIHGDMREARASSATLEDVDPATFGRFCTFLYGKTYEAADHTYGPSSLPGSSADPRSLERGYEDEGNGGMHQPGRADAWRRFNALSLPDLPSDTIACQFRKNKAPEEDYTDVFLSHARLYVFADYYDIKDLGKLSLYNLGTALEEFKLYVGRTNDVTELLRYAYANTMDATSTEGTKCPLRQLIANYAACYIETFMMNQRFQELLSEANEIAVDVMRDVMKRIGK